MKIKTRKSEENCYEETKIDSKRIQVEEKLFDRIYYDIHIGTDLETGDLVTLKRILKRKPVQKLSSERRVSTKMYFIVELDAIRSLNHTSLIHFVGAFETQSHYILVSEFCEREELIDRFIRLKHYTEKDICTIVTQLFGGLQYMHELGQIHRDIRINNIYFSDLSDNISNIVITDYGLIRALDENNKFYAILDTYAPEVVENREGSKFGHEVDVWSVGALAYTLLCGYPPFTSHSRDPRQAKKRIILGTFCFHSPVWDIISKGAKHFITSAMKTVPKDRINIHEALAFNVWVKGEAAENIDLYSDMERHIKITSQKLKSIK